MSLSIEQQFKDIKHQLCTTGDPMAYIVAEQIAEGLLLECYIDDIEKPFADVLYSLCVAEVDMQLFSKQLFILRDAALNGQGAYNAREQYHEDYSEQQQLTQAKSDWKNEITLLTQSHA